MILFMTTSVMMGWFGITLANSATNQPVLSPIYEYLMKKIKEKKKYSIASNHLNVLENLAPAKKVVITKANVPVSQNSICVLRASSFCMSCERISVSVMDHSVTHNTQLSGVDVLAAKLRRNFDDRLPRPSDGAVGGGTTSTACYVTPRINDPTKHIVAISIPINGTTNQYSLARIK